MQQKRSADSLDLIIKSKKANDSTKAIAYVHLCELLGPNNPDTILPLCFKAQKYFESALQKFDHKKSPGPAYVSLQNKLILVYNAIGENYTYNAEYTKSIEFHTKSLNLSKELNSNADISYSFNEIALDWQSIGEIKLARQYYDSSLTIRKQLNDPEALAVTNMNLGILFINLGEVESATLKFEESLNLLRSMGDQANTEDIRGRIANCLNSLAYICRLQSNYQKALEYNNESLKIREDLKLKKDIAVSMNNIGLIYDYLGNVNKALEYYEKCYKIREEIKDRIGMAVSLSNIGSIYKTKNNPVRSLEYYEKSLVIRKETGDKIGMSLVLNNMGNAHLSIGDSLKAIEYYKQSLKLREELNNKHGIIVTLVCLSKIYTKKDPRVSLNFAKRAMELSMEMKLPENIKNSSVLLLDLYSNSNEFENAKENSSRIHSINKNNVASNFPFLSEKEKELFFATLENDYMRLNSFVLQFKDKDSSLVELAYNNSLTNKGLLLKSSTAMRYTILESNDSLLIKKYNNWIALKKKISQLYSKGRVTNELEENANQLEKELVKNSRAFGDLDKVQKLMWTDIREKLKKDEAAIEFINFTHQGINDSVQKVIYCALVIKKGSRYPEMIQLFSENTLKKILGAKSETNDVYITGIYGKKNKANTQLYNLVWKPLEKNLKGINTIYYSPSGLLHKISFAALSKSQDVYLCDNHRLELQGSTGKLATPEKFEFSDQSTVSVFGDIQYDTPETLKDTSALLNWPYLEGTKTESEKIVSILRLSNLKTGYLNAKNATETEFKSKAPQNNIVHIATHGFFFPDPDTFTYSEKQDENLKETVVFRGGDRAVGIYNFVINKNPLMRSGLVFAGANEVWVREENTDKEDGVLTAQEVATLDLRKTNLVVLSACETGLGDIKGTEGVYGLQRAFKMAGVKYIIMSLWQVPDAETVEFMDKFYTKLVKTKDIKTSFYETRNEMRKKYDPFYWAAFVLLE